MKPPESLERRALTCQRLGHALIAWPHLPLSVCTTCGVTVPRAEAQGTAAPTFMTQFDAGGNQPPCTVTLTRLP